MCEKRKTGGKARKGRNELINGGKTRAEGKNV